MQRHSFIRRAAITSRFAAACALTLLLPTQVNSSHHATKPELEETSATTRGGVSSSGDAPGIHGPADPSQNVRQFENAKVLFGLLMPPDDLDPKMIRLGKQLFHDPILSEDKTISCASCHNLSEGGDDNIARSIGITGRPVARNSPTVFNLAGQIGYFWDGRAATLEEQIDEPIIHPDEMGSNWPLVTDRLNRHPEYRRHFAAVFGELPSPENIKQAIAEFEKSLVTNDSPFDDYLRGDMGAISAQAKRGMATFIDLGCVSCHQGPLLGGNLFQKLGVFKDFSHNEQRETRFKVPSLRNVAVTAPYFHDGSTETLTGAIRIMSEFQLGHSISDQEVQDLNEFLETLTSRKLMVGRNVAAGRLEQ